MTGLAQITSYIAIARGLNCINAVSDKERILTSLFLQQNCQLRLYYLLPLNQEKSDM
jgi:hypothetical protein